MTSTRKGEGGGDWGKGLQLIIRFARRGWGDWGKGLQLIIRFVRRGREWFTKLKGVTKLFFFIVEVINELWLQAINSFMLFNMDMPGKVDHFADIS